MPLLSKIEDQSSILLLWAITEDQESLEALVNKEDLLSATRFSNEGRRIQHLAARAALRTLLPRAVVSYHPETGAPRLESPGLHISISHTEGIAVVMISKQRCGVDVESLSRDFTRQVPRYLTVEEQQLADGGHPWFNAVAWCVKEAVYKYSGRRGVGLLHDIEISEINISAGVVSALLCDMQIPEISLHLGPDYVVAYITDEPK